MPTPSVSCCQPGGSCSRPHVVREGHARGGRSAEENHHQKTKKPEAYDTPMMMTEFMSPLFGMQKRRWLSPHRTSALMCERKLCGRQALRTIGPTVDLPANMQEGKRRSLRSQAAPPGAVAVNGMVGGVAEHSGVCGVPGLESLHSLSSRSSTASPTPTVGTAIGSHGATSPASEVVAPQQRLRRPMNSFLLYSNEHRKTRLLTSARHVARPAPFVLSRGCTRRSGMVSCTLSASPPPHPTFLSEQLEVQSTRILRL